MTTEANAFFEANKNDPLAIKLYAAANNIPEAKFAAGGLVSFAAGGATTPKYNIVNKPFSYSVPSVSDYTNAVAQLKKTNLNPAQREFYETLKATSLSNIKNYFDSAARSVYDKEKPLELILDRVKNGTASAKEIEKAKKLNNELNGFRRNTTKALWEPLGSIEKQDWYKKNPELAEVFAAGKASFLSAHKDAGDLYTSFNPAIKDYKPPKHTASADIYDKIDPNTGFPILNRNNLDSLFNANGTTKLNSNILRENYNQYGWNIKSDGSTALHGPAIFGLTYGPLPSTGMSGSPGSGIQGDYEAAAKSLGIDLSTYAKPARWQSQPTGQYGGNTTPVLGQNATLYTDPTTGEKYIAQYDPSKKQPVYEVDGAKLYNDIYDKTKDFYLVAGATEKSKGLNKKTNHASVLYRGDAEGNLIPVVNPETGKAYSNTYRTPTASSSTWYGDIFDSVMGLAGDLLAMPPIQMALMFAAPGSNYLTQGIQGFSQALGTTLSKEATAAIAKGLMNFGGTLVATKGDFEKALTSGLTSGVFSYYTPTVVDNIVGLGDATKGAQFVKDLSIAGGITPKQAYKIIENAGATATKNGDPNQFVSQIAAQFAGAVTSNNVAQFLDKQDKKTINFFSGVAGDFANLSAGALANGMSLEDAWAKYGTDIVTNRIQDYGESTLEELKPPKKDTTTALPVDQVNALNPPGSDPITGPAETDVLDGEIPDWYREATKEEVDLYDLAPITLPNGDLKYVLDKDVPLPDDPNQKPYDEEINVDPDLLDPDFDPVVIDPTDIPKDPNQPTYDETDPVIDPEVLDPEVDTINPEDIPEDPYQPEYDETDPDVDPLVLDPEVDTLNPEDIPEDPHQPGYDETDPDVDPNLLDPTDPTKPPVTPVTPPIVKPPVTPPIVKPPVTPPKTTANTGSNAMALLSLLQGQQQAPAQNITPQELAKIGYFYDVGGQDIFAPTQAKKEEKQDPYKQFYATGGTVDDLFRILRN
jgi:hypothetical protein